MPNELANILLDVIDYLFNKVKCRQIELMIPKLMKMVENDEKIGKFDKVKRTFKIV